MTMHYSDDDGRGIGWLNDDIEPCTYEHKGELTEKHRTIRDRLMEYVGVPDLVKEGEE